ncbi:MAG: polyprenyl synthetase family protein [Butyrivibrio sp.]
MMNFSEELDIRSRKAGEIVSKYVPAADGFNSEIISAMSYSINAGGKRLRPILIQSFCKLYSGDILKAEPFMAAMEMLHTYSLVHDDLPVIDNDDYRRGVPTTHKKFGEGVAVLAGDGLLHLAYETALTALFANDNLNNSIEAIRIFGFKTGLNGMFGGQSADVINTGKDICDSLLHYIYEKKTGALIEGSMMIGAAIAGAPREDIDIIEKIGADIGLAFQIRDDILDICGDENVLGKPINSDEKNHKKTYLSIYGQEQSEKDILKLTDRAVNSLNGIGNNNKEREFLIALFGYLTSRNV